MTAHDVARDFVPYDGIDIPEVRQTALDLLIGGIAGLQVFAGIVFGGLHPRNGNDADFHARVDLRHVNLLHSQ